MEVKLSWDEQETDRTCCMEEEMERFIQLKKELDE